jgi:hypothetical protein
MFLSQIVLLTTKYFIEMNSVDVMLASIGKFDLPTE